MPQGAHKPRLSIEVDADLCRRLEAAAAQHDVTVQQYVLAAVEHTLEVEDRKDWARLSEPSFDRDWNSQDDEVYDRI